MDAVKSDADAGSVGEEQVLATLLSAGHVKEGDLSRVRRVEDVASDGLLALLVRLGLVSERHFAEACVEALGLRPVHDDDIPDLPPEVVGISLRFMKEFHVVPLADSGSELELLVAYPHNTYALDAVALATGRQVLPRIGLRSQIEVLIERWYGTGRSAMGEILEFADDTAAEELDDVEQLRDLASGAPVVRLVNLIVQRAVDLRASDIHVEPLANRLKVRYRIDGVLEEGESPPAGLTAAVVSRIKIMAKLNIAERRLPQDGRIMVRAQGRELDLRVSTMPTAHGESVVIRLLDRETVEFDFEELGFSNDLLPRVQRLLQQPHGILLVTGPTGSGKTTTLYAALSRLNTPDVKIISVEDPVEYQIDGINQIPVKPHIGLDFAHALRSIVRQDPDIIMIGEMRDLETARIAIQSALTGHLVLSTLHTNNAAGGITRLLDMGVEDYLLTSAVNGILAQRLVRRLDPESAERYLATAEQIEKFGLRRYQPEGEIHLYRARPSPTSPTGYRGRTSIVELLEMNDELRRAVIRHEGMEEIDRIAKSVGMRGMHEDGIQKALLGITTIEEVLRVAEEG